jgi:hypothetical protein
VKQQLARQSLQAAAQCGGVYRVRHGQRCIRELALRLELDLSQRMLSDVALDPGRPT